MRAAGKSTTDDTDPEIDRELARHSGLPAHPAAATWGLGAVIGALGGVAFGAVAGPVGMVIGGILGAVGGAGVGDAVARIQEHRSSHDERIDHDIGVIGGDLGAADPDQPPPLIGAYSSAAAGGAGTAVEATPDEGPIPKGA